MTPEQEEQVRRALGAAARAEDRLAAQHPGADRAEVAGPTPAVHDREQDAAPGPQPDREGAERRDPPIPPEVAARLDLVLGDLAAPLVATSTAAGARTGGGSTGAGPADELADELAARRRGRWLHGLVAAAALCVIALAGGAVVTDGFGDGGGQSDSTAGSAGASTDGGEGSSADSGDTGTGSSQERAAPASPEAAPSAGGRALAAGPGGPSLRRATLARDVQRLVDRGLLRRSTGLDTGASPTTTCAAPTRRSGEVLRGVRLDGRRSTLVLGAPDGGRQAARVFSCDDPDVPVATATVRSAGR